jgi:uncharacterized membrane protein (UPF0127 family)
VIRARQRVASVLFLVILGACAQEEVTVEAPASSPGATTPPALSFAGSVTVRFGEHAVQAEVAATTEQRQRGLMFQTSLASDAGMLFIFTAPSQGGFWMKNTLIPLSIAYMHSAGTTEGGPVRYTVVSILDMVPCEADPCPSYAPGGPYDAALEVNQGWFAERGIEAGAEAVVEGDLPAPS